MLGGEEIYAIETNQSKRDTLFCSLPLSLLPRYPFLYNYSYLTLIPILFIYFPSKFSINSFFIYYYYYFLSTINTLSFKLSPFSNNFKLIINLLRSSHFLFIYKNKKLKSHLKQFLLFSFQNKLEKLLLL